MVPRNAILYGKRQNKNKQKIQKCGNSVPKKAWSKILGGPLWDGEEKEKKAGSIPGQPRRFLQPITPHKERCDYVCSSHLARARINRVRLPVLLVVN